MPYTTTNELMKTRSAPGVITTQMSGYRSYTMSINSVSGSYSHRTGTNMASVGSKRRGSKIRKILRYRWVTYRDHSARKVREVRTIKRKVFRIVKKEVTFVDQTAPAVQVPVYIPQLKRLVLKWRKPTVTKIVLRKVWTTVTSQVTRWVFPRVTKLAPVYAKPDRKSSGMCYGRSDMLPNALLRQTVTTRMWSSDGAYATKPGTIGCQLLGDITGSMFTFDRLRPAGGTFFNLGVGVSNVDVLQSEYSPVAARVSQTALTRLYAKVRNCDLNLGVALAEASQTAQLLYALIKRFRDIARAIRRNDLAFFVRAFSTRQKASSKTPSDLWLEYQYAIIPLIMDIKAAVAQLSKAETVEFDVITTAQEVLPTAYQSYSTTTGISFQDHLWTDSIVQVRYKARLRVENPLLRVLSQLGLTNLSSIVWEKVPFSFLVDWVLPIGKALESLHSLDGLSVVYWHKTSCVRRKQLATRVFSGTDSLGYKWVSGSGGWERESFYCRREVMTASLPKPPMPKFKNPFSLGHSLNAAALYNSLRK